MTLIILDVDTIVRGCGLRKEYGVYLVGGAGGSENGALARFVRINPPIPYQVKHHRGPKIVDANAVLQRQPISEWWTGSSKDSAQKQSADQWALEVFGMTEARRRSTGECKGAKSVDEALAILVSCLSYNPTAAKFFARITRSKIQELPRLVADYSILHENMLAASNGGGTVDNLVNAQAAVWRMAYNLPPRKRELYVEDLARILYKLGLKKDAQALITTFGG